MRKTENKYLHWYNIPDMHSRTVTIKDFFYRQLYKKTGLKKKTPVIVYMMNGIISGLDEFRHSDEARKIINEKGMHIYLYEPICSRVREEDQFNAGFYGEFPFDENKTDLYCAEFETIRTYVKKNKLSSVTVHTCDYDVEKYYLGYSKYFRIVCDDIFLRSQTFEEVLPDEYRSYRNFQKKFICHNWRYAKHRHLISSFLQDKDCYLSWYYKSSVDDLKRNLWFDISDWIDHSPDVYNKVMSGAVRLENAAPLVLDVVSKSPTPMKGKRGYNIYPDVDVNPCLLNNKKDSLRNFYRESFCSIITESRFAQPTANISEKTFISMHYRRPFILVGAPRSIEYLKKLGFLTFSDFWDETYDSVDQHDQRLLKIFELIDSIYSMPTDSLIEMYMRMQDILDYNEKRVVEFFNG